MSQALRSPIPTAFFLAIFVLSGFAGLIYESIWSHYLKLFLGHAAYAQALVLMIFMGGMAGGAALAARFSLKIKHALLAYAAVELLIGLTALIFHTLFNGATQWAYDSVMPSLGSPAAIETFKWFLAAMLILPQSLLLGSTFPLMSAGLVRRDPAKAGYNLSMLYFTNSLGAAAGVLVSGFVLIGWVGLPGALLTAGIVNVTLALVVWAMLKADPDETRSVAVQEPYKQLGTQTSSRSLVIVLLAATFLTSAASFFYEIGWIRMLSMVLGAATHSFELMLSSFILGLAIGGFLIRGYVDKMQNPLLVLVIIQIVMGTLAAVTVPLYGLTFDMMAWVLDALGRTSNGYVLFSEFKHLIAMLVMLPTTIMAGMTLPIITHTLLKAGQGEQAIGKVYAINTLGAIAGVITASLLIMPMFGLRAVILGGALLDIAVGLMIWWLLRHEQGMGATQKSSVLPWTAGGALVLWVGIALFLPFNLALMASGVYRTGSLGISETPKRELIEHYDGTTATVTTFFGDNSHKSITIATNGKPDASMTLVDIPAQDEMTQSAVAWTPLALHPTAKDVAIIGFGSGYTAHVLLGDENIRKLDVIEIEPKMVEGARKAFGEHLPRVFNDPRSQIYINDAKTFFSANNSKYDLIIGEPSNPWVSGVASLFTQEFYQRIKKHLNEDGLYVQWVQGYEINLDLVATIFAALVKEFDDVQLYFLGNADFMLMAKPHGKLPPISDRPFKQAEIIKSMQRVGLETLPEIELRQAAGKQILAAIVQALDAKPNSDFFPLLDQGAEKTRFTSEDVSELVRLRTEGSLLLEVADSFAPLKINQISKNDHTPIGQVVRNSLGFNCFMREWALGGIQGAAQTCTGISSDNKRTLKVLLGNDTCPDDVAELWFFDADRLLEGIMPYAQVGELVPAIDKMKTLNCALGHADAQSMLDFYKAYNARDFAGMASAAKGLIASDRIKGNFKKAIAFNAAIAAYALKDIDQAKAFWQPYAGKHAPGEIEFRVFDMILGNAIVAKKKVDARNERIGG